MKCLAKAEQAVTSAALVAFAFAGVLAVGADAGTALADSQIAVYGGWNDSFDSDITLKQPNGTNMTLHDVPWDGVSSEAPPYWGIRGTWWLANNPNWGLMFDYSHAKVVADKGAVVSVSGRRDGTAIGPTDKVGNTFQVMEFTDGLNEFFFGAQYRWPHERWTPYVGFGVGRQCRTSRSGVLASASLIPSNINWPASTLRVWSVSNTGSAPMSPPSLITNSASQSTIPTSRAADRWIPIYGRTTSFLASPTGSGLRRVRPIRRLRPAPRRSGSVKWSGECPYWDKRKRLI
jgi:hypothetical protein